MVVRNLNITTTITVYIQGYYSSEHAGVEMMDLYKLESYQLYTPGMSAWHNHAARSSVIATVV